MIALLIGYEAISRLFTPVPIRFAEAIPIACLGLGVNIASAWLLSGGEHHHGPAHAHDHSQGRDHDETHHIAVDAGMVVLDIVEDGKPARFRLRGANNIRELPAESTSLATVRPGGARQEFTFIDRGGYLESADEVPEPHAFEARLRIAGCEHTVRFEEHEHAPASAHHDYNIRAAVVHVIADATVSVLVIAGLLLARAFGWLWMDPLAGMIGAFVIASWSYGLMRDTGAILLDMNPDQNMADSLRQMIERDGDQPADFHLRRLGPGHLGAIVSIATHEAREPDYYRARLARFRSLSHVTIEVQSYR